MRSALEVIQAEKITILSYCDDRIFEIGDKLKIEPIEKPNKTQKARFKAWTGLNLIQH